MSALWRSSTLSFSARAVCTAGQPFVCNPAAPVPLAIAGEVGKGTSWRAAARAGCDIISLAWLQRCADAGQRVDPRPCEYLQLSTATLQASGWVLKVL